MKLAALFATVALAQDSMGDGRAMSLQKKIDNAGKKCSVYMEKAMVCDPPAGKIGKYNFRLEKVMTSSNQIWINTNVLYQNRSSRMPNITWKSESATLTPATVTVDTDDDVTQRKNWRQSSPHLWMKSTLTMDSQVNLPYTLINQLNRFATRQELRLSR